MSTTWKCTLVISSKVFVALKQKMLHDVTIHDFTDRAQAYFQRQKDEASNFAAG